MDSKQIWIVGLGVVGVVVSWVYFVQSTLEYGFLESWALAFRSVPHSVGLHWDLVFSDLIVCSMAVFDRKRLGSGYVAATIAMGITLGVCAGLPVYWIGMRRARGPKDAA